MSRSMQAKIPKGRRVGHKEAPILEKRNPTKLPTALDRRQPSDRLVLLDRRQ
jgi:hypothetical protein